MKNLPQIPDNSEEEQTQLVKALLVLPEKYSARIVLLEETAEATHTGSTDTNSADWDSLTAAGVTTALVEVDLSAIELSKNLAEILVDPPPLNAALVGTGGASAFVWCWPPSPRC